MNRNTDEDQLVDLTEARHHLDAFLVDNDELEELSAKLAKFNLLRILGAENAEIRHSNVLAWLLTPGESHGLGGTFTRRFLSRLLMENDSLEIPLTPAKVELMSFDDVEVLREWQNIDLLVRSASGGWCLLIENKIKSKEARGQLARYLEAVRREFPDAAMIPVFLTLAGDDPSEEGREAGYVSLSYIQILELAEKIVEQNRSRIPDDAQVLLAHYLDSVRRLTMQDEDLVDLCRAIYRKHREAVDLIVQYGATSQVLDACEERLRGLVEPVAVQRTAHRLWFLPSSMSEVQQQILADSGWRFLLQRYPVWWWFRYKKERATLYLTMEVGPIADSDLRIRLLEAIKAAGFSFWEKGAFRKEAKYTRILTEKQKLRTSEDGDPDEDSDYVRGAAESLWKKAWQEGEKIVDVLRQFRWDQL